MNCGRFEKLIDAYLDAQLSGALLAEFHAHRLNCRRCSRVVSMLQAAGDVIAQDHCEPKISVDFADRVLAAMPAAQKVNRSVWLVRLGASAAGLAAAAAITMAVLLSNQAPTRLTAIAGEVAVAKGSGLVLPKGSQDVVHQAQNIAVPVVESSDDASHNGLFDGQVVRDAVNNMNKMMQWDEATRTGQ